MKQQIFIGISLLFTVIFFFASCQKSPEEWILESPSGNLKVIINLDKQGNSALSYRVNRLSGSEEITALEDSPLGIIRDDEDFVGNLRFSSASEVKIIDNEYEMLIGKQLKNRDHAREMTLSFINENDAEIQLIWRAYDEGFAFRYHFPGEEGKKVRLQDELTAFNLPDEGKVWIHPYDTISPWAPAYEQFYQNAIDIGAPAPENKNGWSFPALFNANDLWVLLSESDLDGNYCGMHLEDDPVDGVYSLRLPEKIEAMDTTGQKPESVLPWTTPWRFGIVSDKLSDIVESNLVYHLARPSVLENTAWIEPGVSSWSWWSDGDSPRDYDKLKAFVDFSADYGFRYSLVDANWNEMKGGNLEKLADYARSQGVGLLVWYNSGGAHNEVTEKPRNIFSDPDLRRKELKWLKEIGARGIKVDFFQSDKQEIINLYLDILRDAARENILVNFHGCTLPRGWSRTYPNLLTMEAIRGGEAYRFDRLYTDYGPVHNTIIPFTRNVVGPVDYTPVTYSDNRYPHTTSFAHETALSVIFESGILHLADHYRAYNDQPPYVQEFLKEVPVTWDETRLIEGMPGKWVVMARRKADKWYVAGINGQDEPKDVELDLSFINKNQKLMVISDGENPGKYNYRETSPGTMEIKMLPRGGFILFSSEN